MKSWKPTTHPSEPASLWSKIADEMDAIFTNIVYRITGTPLLRSILLPWFLKNVAFTMMTEKFRKSPRVLNLQRYDALHWRTHTDDWIVEDCEFAIPLTGNDGEVKYENMVKAFLILKDAIERFQKDKKFPVNITTEMRVVSGGSALLSPAHGKPTDKFLFIEFLRSGLYDVHEKELKTVWNEFVNDVCQKWMKEFGILARPHWAKGFDQVDGIMERLPLCFPKWETFKNVRNKWDPNGLFLNDFFKTLFSK
jgi:hypothetical protein